MQPEIIKEMIIVKLMGGLGNQMFQYAAGRSLSLKNNCSLNLDLSFLQDLSDKPDDYVVRDYDLDIFDLPVGFAGPEVESKLAKRSSNKNVNRILNKLLGKKPGYYKQPYFHFDESFYRKKPPLYLEGYWQSEKFFKPVESVIRQDFTFKEPIQQHSESLLQEIRHSNSICVNVRRGDFVSSDTHALVDLDYYRTADQIIRSRIDDPAYYIFSDDIEWCRNNLQFYTPGKYITHLHAGRKFGCYLQLMASCKHFIIPNSSFGWWAAWLSNKPDKIVIAPEKWFNKGPLDTQDLIPAEWLKV